MATSTSTLLEVANRILLNANERPLSNLTTLIGQQVKETIRAAYYKLLREGEWLWNRNKINASSWSSNVATLPTNTQRIKSVGWQNDDGIITPLTFLSQGEVEQYVVDPYNSTTLPGRALYWTMTDYNIAVLHPYPNDATERGRIWFYTNYVPTFPGTDATVFPMPEDFIPILVLMGTGMFIKRHSDDAQLARNFEEEYVVELSQLRARQMTRPGNSWNFYKGRKHNQYGIF